VTEPAVRVEASGETVGEARWAALHELERRYPNLDRELVEFAVVSEGQRGLLGVGYEPARVVAVLAEEPPPAAKTTPAPPAREPAGPAPDDSEAAGLVRELLGRVVHGLGIDADVEIEETPGRVTGTVAGGDLGLLIGRHGQTIDAIQYLANAVVHRRGAGSVEVVIDAEGYRERRERALCGVADRAAAEALRTGRPVALDPMTSVERKIVHLHLQETAGVGTSSEGAEPNRHVIVLPEGDSAEV
jgi:spoIIIJ-associated protein